MAYPVISNNSPSTGSIAWTAFSIQYAGVAYPVAAGNTANTFVWWRHNNGSPLLQTGNTVPQDLTEKDLILFGNKNGTGIFLPGASLVDGGLIVNGTILADALSANSVTAPKILAGAVDATKIAANSIQARHMLIGSFDNILFDPQFTQALDATNGPWQAVSGVSRLVGGGRDGVLNAVTFTGDSTTKAIYNLPYDWLAVVKDSSFYMGTWVKSTATIPIGGVWIGMRAKTTTASYVYPYVANTAVIPANTWTWIEGRVTLTSDVATATPFLSVRNTVTSGTVSVTEPAIMRAGDGRLLIDGTIEATKLKAGTITATSTIFAESSIQNAWISTLSANKIETGDLEAAVAILGALTAGGGLIEILPPEQDGDTLIGGIIIHDPANPDGEPLVQLHPGGSTFKGKIYADVLTVLQNLLINGDASLSSGGTFTIKNGIANPTSAPSLSTGSITHQTWPAVPSGYTMRGMCWDETNSRWIRLLWRSSNSRAYLQVISTAGVASSAVTLANPSGSNLQGNTVSQMTDCYGLATNGTNIYWGAEYYSTGGDTCLALVSSSISTGAQSTCGISQVWAGFFSRIDIAYISGKVFVWDVSLDGPAGSFLYRYSPTNLVTSEVTWDAGSAGVQGPGWGYTNITAAGVFNDTELGSGTLYLCFSGNAYAFTGFNATIASTSTQQVLTYDAAKTFNYVGGYITTRPGVGIVSNQNGQPMVRWSTYFPNNDSSWTARYADMNGSLTTQASPAATINNVGKRHFVTVTLPPAPAGVSTSRVWVGYASSGAAGTVYQRAEALSGRVMQLTSGKVTNTSTTLPASNTLGGSPAELKSEVGGVLIRGDGYVDLPGQFQPHFRAEHSAGTSVGSSSENAISWGSIQNQDEAFFSLSNATRDITVARAGVYQINTTVGYSANNTGVRYAYIYVNNTNEAVTTAAAATTNITMRVSLSQAIRLNAGDIVSIRGWQNSGATLTFLTGPSCSVSMTRISA